MILVSGGAGYIGSHTVAALDRAGYRMVVVDNLSLGRRGAVKSGRLVELDLRDREGLAGLIASFPIEGIIHFAALSRVGQSVSDPLSYYENNLIGGLNLFSLAAEAAIPVVFSSSAAVYGNPLEVPIPESHPLAPISPYGYGKMVLERVLGDYHRAFGLASMSLRYFNAAGAEPWAGLGEAHDPETHLIPIVLETALGRREAVSIFGTDFPTPDGTCVRDYIHVADLAQAHILALDFLRREGGAHRLNLGLGRGVSVRQVIEACARVTGRKIRQVEADRREGDPPELVADPSRAGQLLGWKPAITELEEIVATAWDWHRSLEPSPEPGTGRR